jgi:hypothetical protein
LPELQSQALLPVGESESEGEGDIDADAGERAL